MKVQCFFIKKQPSWNTGSFCAFLKCKSLNTVYCSFLSTGLFFRLWNELVHGCSSPSPQTKFNTQSHDIQPVGTPWIRKFGSVEAVESIWGWNLTHPGHCCAAGSWLGPPLPDQIGPGCSLSLPPTNPLHIWTGDGLLCLCPMHLDWGYSMCPPDIWIRPGLLPTSRLGLCCSCHHSPHFPSLCFKFGIRPLLVPMGRRIGAGLCIPPQSD